MKYDDKDLDTKYNEFVDNSEQIHLNCNSKEELDVFNIYQLRYLGWQVGVRRPTTYKKAELIDEIWSVYTGEKKPHIKASKKGNSSKNLEKLQGLTQKVDESSLSDKFSLTKSQILTLNSSSYDFERAEELSKVDVCGVVLKQQEYYVLIPNNWCDDVYFILNIVVEKYHLSTGDYIEAKAESKEDFNRLIVTKVININGNPIDYSTNIDFMVAKPIDTKKELFVSTNEVEKYVLNTICPIKTGDRVIICANDKLELVTGIYSNIKKLSLNPNNEIICILLNSTPEHIKVFENIENIRLISASFDVDDVCQTGQFELALKHIQRLVTKTEKNVIEIVVDIDNVISEFKKANISKEDCMKLLDQNFSLAKNIQNNSLTIMYGMLYNNDGYLEFNGTENVKIALSDRQMLTISDYKIDILNTYRTDMSSLYEINELDKAIRTFVALGDYNSQHLKFEQIMKSCSSVKDLLEKLK